LSPTRWSPSPRFLTIDAFLRADMHRANGNKASKHDVRKLSRGKSERSQRVPHTLFQSIQKWHLSPHANLFSGRVARIAGRTILNRNGVIQNIVYMGELQLPQQIKKHGSKHFMGHYFLMRFYGAPYLVKDIGRHLALDPRTLRHNVVKLGDKYHTRVVRWGPEC
jgi:ribosomal protein S6